MRNPTRKRLLLAAWPRRQVSSRIRTGPTFLLNIKATSTDRSPSPKGTPPHADPRRWDELITRLKPASMVLIIGSSMSRELKQHCSPEDLWQETLSHAWRDRAKHEWRNEVAVRAWLFEIMRNRIREAARSLTSQKRGAGRAARCLTDLRASAATTLSPLLPADSATPSRIVSRAEKARAVEHALSRMPSDLARIMRLHAVEELTMEAIAEKLGLSLSAAWRRYRKGAEIFARFLKSSGTGGSSARP